MSHLAQRICSEFTNNPLHLLPGEDISICR
jgi:hypothetical protein